MKRHKKHLHRSQRSSLSSSCVFGSHIRWAGGRWCPRQRTRRTCSPHSTLRDDTGRQNSAFNRSSTEIKTAVKIPLFLLSDVCDGHFNFPRPRRNSSSGGGAPVSMLSCYRGWAVCGCQPFWHRLQRILSATCPRRYCSKKRRQIKGTVSTRKTSHISSAACKQMLMTGSKLLTALRNAIVTQQHRLKTSNVWKMHDVDWFVRLLRTRTLPE